MGKGKEIPIIQPNRTFTNTFIENCKPISIITQGELHFTSKKTLTKKTRTNCTICCLQEIHQASQDSPKTQCGRMQIKVLSKWKL